MNYTINEIPDTATEANNTDYAIMWQDKTKKISISNLFKKLVKKSEVTNTISPINENPITSKAVSSLLTISASTTTITDAPPLQNGITLRIFFTSEIVGTDDTTVLQISYNGTSYNVKVPKDGALQNYVAFEVSSGVFKYLQAFTTLELLFDGTQFVIVGNPVVLSGSNYLYYADGSHNTNTVASGNMQSVTSDGVYGALLTPYLAFDKDTKTWSWYDYNTWDTSKPLRNGQLVVVYCTQGLSSAYWSGDTQGVINLSLQNTNSEKSIRYKCIGIVKDSYIDIIS